MKTKQTEKKKTLAQFRADVRKEYGWNAAIGFWHEIEYNMYKRDKLQYFDLMQLMKELSTYKGI